jgi:hypothetical protein
MTFPIIKGVRQIFSEILIMNYGVTFVDAEIALAYIINISPILAVVSHIDKILYTTYAPLSGLNQKSIEKSPLSNPL